MTRTRVCMFEWTDNNGKPGSNHTCGEPHSHAGKHKCASCAAEHDGALPLEAATQLYSTGNPAVDAAIDRLLDLPADVKPTEAADRIADLLEAIAAEGGAPEALDMAKRVRDARCDGDRLIGVLDELESVAEAARNARNGVAVAS